MPTATKLPDMKLTSVELAGMEPPDTKLTGMEPPDTGHATVTEIMMVKGATAVMGRTGRQRRNG